MVWLAQLLARRSLKHLPSTISPVPFSSYGLRVGSGYMFRFAGLAQLPWLSGEKFKPKNYLSRYEIMVGIFALARDERG